MQGAWSSRTWNIGINILEREWDNLLDNTLCHEELKGIGDEPGNVTAEEYDDNTDKYSCMVHIFLHWAVGPDMGVSGNIAAVERST